MTRYLLPLALLAALPFAASAQTLEYSWVEAGYDRLDPDTDGLITGDPDAHGYYVRGSAAIGPSAYLFGGYETATNDDFGVDIDLDLLQAGYGYHHAMSERADLLAEVSYLRTGVEIDGFGSEHGEDWRGSVGVRGAFSDNFEGLAKANYTDGDTIDGDFSGTVGAQLKFSPAWGFTAEVEFGEDYSKYLLGLRARF